MCRRRRCHSALRFFTWRQHYEQQCEHTATRTSGFIIDAVLALLPLEKGGFWRTKEVQVQTPTRTNTAIPNLISFFSFKPPQFLCLYSQNVDMVFEKELKRIVRCELPAVNQTGDAELMQRQHTPLHRSCPLLAHTQAQAHALIPSHPHLPFRSISTLNIRV